MADLFAGAQLKRFDGSKLVDASAADLKGKTVALYFSAHWCPPCRNFTPKLAAAYKQIIASGKPFEVVFVTSDRSKEDQLNYMKEAHGNWLTLPHGDAFINTLKTKYGISGIPALIVLRPDGTTVSAGARGEVESKGADAFSLWQ